MLVHLAGAASFSPPSISVSPSLPSSRSVSLARSLSLGAYSAPSVPVRFFSPAHSFTVSQRWQLGDAAVCASASQLPPVKTAALLDDFNPTGVGGRVTKHSLRCFNFSSYSRAHISEHLRGSILEKRAGRGSWQPDQQITEEKELRLSRTDGKELSETHRDIFKHCCLLSVSFLDFPTASCGLRTVSLTASTSVLLASVI